MAVTIRNIYDGIKYTFPPKPGLYGGFAMEEESVRQRVSVAERLYSHGGAVVGDGKVASRTIGLNGVIQTTGANAAAALEAELDAMKYHCTYGDTFNTERRLYLPQYSRKKYYLLGGMADFSIERLSSIGAAINISWVIPDPFLYARDVDRQTWTYKITMPAGKTWVGKYPTIAAGSVGGDYCYPVCPYSVDVTVSSGKMHVLRMQNYSDESRTVRFNHEMLAGANNRIVYNFTTGTVTGYGGIWGTGIDVIRHVTSAKWWSIRPEGNHLGIAFTGDSSTVVDIIMKWRPRWL